MTLPHGTEVQAARVRIEQIKVSSERLLLVEGQDEVNLLSEIVSQMAETTVQVLEAGGKDRLADRLSAILRNANANRVNLRVIGIVRDADHDPRGALQSVQGTLRRHELPVPRQPLTLAEGNPSTAVLIVPGGNEAGSIEDLCWSAVRDLPAGICVDEFLSCLANNSALQSLNQQKTRVHAYLASQADPTTTVGVGALKGYWPLDHRAFDVLRDFVRLVDQAA